MSVKTNIVKLFTDHGWFELSIKSGNEPEKDLKEMITDFRNNDVSLFKFKTMSNDEIEVKAEIKRMIVNGNEIHKIKYENVKGDNSNFLELKHKYDDVMGKHGEHLKKEIVQKMYHEIKPKMKPSEFAGMFDAYYGFSGYMCEILERWLS